MVRASVTRAVSVVYRARFSLPFLVEGTEALARQAPEFRPVIDTFGPADLRRARPHTTHFAELVRDICYQQLAGAAARTIHGRLVAALDGDPTPEAVLALPVESLRAAGLSANKAASIRDLSEKCLSKEVPLAKLREMSDEAAIEALIPVRGIGRWTAEMFLIFSLGRLNVLPVGDYGLRAGVQRLYDLPKIPKPSEVKSIAEKWAPYSSVATWYIWRSFELVPPSTSQGNH